MAPSRDGHCSLRLSLDGVRIWEAECKLGRLKPINQQNFIKTLNVSGIHLLHFSYLIFLVYFIIGIWKPIPTDKVLFVLCSDLFSKNKKPCFYYMTKLKNWTFIFEVISKWDCRHIRRKLKVSYYFNKCKPTTIPAFTLIVF